MSVLAAADTSVHLGGGEAVVFWILGPIALAGALGMVLSRNAVHSALLLVDTMLCSASSTSSRRRRSSARCRSSSTPARS